MLTIFLARPKNSSVKYNTLLEIPTGKKEFVGKTTPARNIDGQKMQQKVFVYKKEGLDERGMDRFKTLKYTLRSKYDG